MAAGVTLLVWGGGWTGQAQNLLPNGGFEAGTNQPAGWTLQEGPGRWSYSGYAGRRCLSVRGTGDDQSIWRSAPLSLPGGHLYRLTFWARRGVGSKGGTAVAGPDRVNRDFHLSEQWQAYSFVFSVPSDAAETSIRLGQWHLDGRAYFDQVELTRVLAVEARSPSGQPLGDGESVHHGVYSCRMDFDGVGSDYQRTLVCNRAGFNSDRWVFSPGASVTYRHGLKGIRQKSAWVQVAINYYQGGSLKIEASRDGVSWSAVKILTGEHRAAVTALPSKLFPASQIFIRLVGAGNAANFQVNTYDYEAVLADPASDARGSTRFVDVLKRDPAFPLSVTEIRLPEGSGTGRMECAVKNPSGQTARLALTLGSEGKGSGHASVKDLTISPGGKESVALPIHMDRVGLHVLKLEGRTESGRTIFAGQTPVKVGFLNDTGFGHRLQGLPDLGLWWCDSGWKVGRERGLPPEEGTGDASSAASPVRVSAAANEYEAAQVVLRPQKDGKLMAIGVAPMRDDQGQTGGITVSVREVAYVRVARPTDSVGWRGWFPDPLAPLTESVSLRANRNQPLWVSFHVPEGTTPGDYHGQLDLETSYGHISVPLELHVYAFTLPRVSHLRSAFGLNISLINRYHHLTTLRQKKEVYEAYLRDFAAHRISPYSFFAYSPIQVRFTGKGPEQRAEVDFTQFDQAARKWIDQYHFNTFRLPLVGMGGGTFASRQLGRLEGHPAGTPEYARLFDDYLGQIDRHLREKGWLKEAFTYWFDEPAPKDYPFVVSGMERLKRAAPDIKRMLTEQPEPILVGNVDIWCGLTPNWSRQTIQERKAAGDEVWWYICTAPKAPYVGEFIDHPGTELRLWPWQSWQYGIEGILIWETDYWTSDLVYPSPRLQNPWKDPMSYVSGYGRPVGSIGYWGNGDGRFLYPPRRDPNKATSADLDGPIDSLRWENLRDGMEDYEYFWRLRKEIERVRSTCRQASLIASAEKLLTIPPSISRDMTHFTTDPRLLIRYRDRVARMIERLESMADESGFK